MSRVRLTGSTSGYTELTAPASAGNNTLVLPTGNGSAGNVLGTDGAGNLSWVNGRMVLETYKAATGTAVDFTGIPSWVKRITVSFYGVNFSGSAVIVQLGDSGGFETTGHLGASSTFTATAVATAAHSGVGFVVANVTSGEINGNMEIVSHNYNNIWTASSTVGRSDAAATHVGAASKGLSATLDRIRITTVSGSGSFIAGTFNILYQG